MRRDCGNKSFDLNIHVKFQKTSETSKSFQNNILSRAIQSAFEINIARNFSSRLLQSRARRQKSSRVSCSMAEETSPVLRKIISKTSNFKEAERAKFPSRIRTIVSRKFSRITKAVSETSHVTDRRVCYS